MSQHGLKIDVCVEITQPNKTTWQWVSSRVPEMQCQTPILEFPKIETKTTGCVLKHGARKWSCFLLCSLPHPPFRRASILIFPRSYPFWESSTDPQIQVSLLWMDEILHHFETMGSCCLWAFTGQSSYQGSLGGAGSHPSAVC